MVMLNITRIGDHELASRPADNYVDATRLCRAKNKKWSHYVENQDTKQFIQAVAESTGIPVDSLIVQQSGRGGGTWVHPNIAVDCARWADPKFGAQVAEWVRELLTTGRVELAPGTVAVPASVLSDLHNRLNAFQAQIDRLSLPPALPIPRVTVQDRLRERGYHDLNAKGHGRARAMIRQQANVWLMLRFNESPDLSGGPGAGHCYYGHQVRVLDEAIDAIVDGLRKRERSRPRLPGMESDAKEAA